MPSPGSHGDTEDRRLPLLTTAHWCPVVKFEVSWYRCVWLLVFVYHTCFPVCLLHKLINGGRYNNRQALPPLHHSKYLPFLQTGLLSQPWLGSLVVFCFFFFSYWCNFWRSGPCFQLSPFFFLLRQAWLYSDHTDLSANSRTLKETWQLQKIVEVMLIIFSGENRLLFTHTHTHTHTIPSLHSNPRQNWWAKSSWLCARGEKGGLWCLKHVCVCVCASECVLGGIDCDFEIEDRLVHYERGLAPQLACITHTHMDRRTFPWTGEMHADALLHWHTH